MIKRTNEEWRALLSEQRASGQPQAKWCEANGVNLHTLRDRASRLKKMDKVLAPGAASCGWLEVAPERPPEAEAPTAAGAACIRITRGEWAVTLAAGFDAEELAVVLRAVGRSCC
jgi:hypothetical protein